MMEDQELFTESARVDAIRDFFKEFKDKSGSYKYLDKIDSMQGNNLMIEFYDLFDYEQDKQPKFKIREYFTTNPKEAVKLTKRVVREIYGEAHPSERDEKLDVDILIDKSGLDITVSQAIKHKYINKLVSLEGRIQGEGPIQNRIIKGVWVCSDGHKTEDGIEPVKCSKKDCSSKDLVLQVELSEIESYRTFYVKDLKFTEHHMDSLIVELTGDLSDSAKMGEVVKFTGYITLERKQSKQEKKLFSVFHGLNVEKVSDVNLEVTQDDIEYFEKLAKEPGHFEKLVNSIAPNIYGAELLKESFLLACLGAPEWDANQKNWINVLSVGDPATAKTKVAEWGYKNLENINLVSSKAVTAKGLFAGQMEQNDGKKILEIGPMVSLSDRGLLCIDEFARMKEVFDIFYTPMETGLFNSAVVGGHEDLEARTAIYATGNPHKSNIWDDDRSIVDNLQVFEPSMLSRFDLIIISKDESSIEDRKLIARTILGQNDSNYSSDGLSSKVLTKFIRYARTVHPKLTNEVKDLIADTFIDIIKKKNQTKNAEINNRLVATLARITLAVARANLHKESTIEDFSKAHELIKIMFAQRGLQASNANTYIVRIGQMIFTILEKSETGLTDHEIYDNLFARFSEKRDMLLNDLGGKGPLRDQNKKWRYVMEDVEKSYMVEIENSKPKRLRWKREQKTLN